MNERIGLINYGAGSPTIGITRYTQELISALHKEKAPMLVLEAGSNGASNGSVSLWGAARAPGLLTLGQVEIAWNAWRQNLALIHDPSGIVPLYLTKAQRVATIHDAIPYIYPEASTMPTRMIYRVWLPIAVQRLDAIITVSHQSKTDLVHYLGILPEKVTVIPQGVDNHYHPLPEEESRRVLENRGIDFPYILYVSAVEPRKKRKNLPRLLEAFAQLLRWSDRWRLVVVGAIRKNYQPVFETVERLGLEPHIHFTGFIPEEELPYFYNGADLFILPSLYEGFGLPVLEAMACGTPVITSNRSSLPEVVGDAALMIDPYDVEAMVEAIKRVLTEPDLAEELRTKGLIQAQEFSWQRTARETLAVYERVLG